jgi:biotin operon repressor
MKAIEQLERLKRMNELIRSGRTGTPEELSDTLRISRRQLYCDLDYCRDLGVEIEYSKQRRTFFYSNGRELEIEYSLRAISRRNLMKINGGFSLKNSSVLFLCTEGI